MSLLSIAVRLRSTSPLCLLTLLSSLSFVTSWSAAGFAQPAGGDAPTDVPPPSSPADAPSPSTSPSTSPSPGTGEPASGDAPVETPPAGDAATPAPANAPAGESEPPKEEDKVGFKWVWLVPELGFSYVNLKSFSETNLAVVDSSESGAMAGVGAGVRIVFLTIGVRARRHFAMDMWQVMGELGLHFKVNRVDPYLAFRGGYDTIGSSLGQAVGNATGNVELDVKGFNFGGALGFDYFVADNVTLGVEGSGDFLFLTRPAPALPAGLPPAQQAAIKANPLYQNAGSSVGFGGVLAARVGVHF
jgi:hypothetical protein